MMTFKEFLGESSVYYGDYPELRTHKNNLMKFKERLGATFGIPRFRFAIIPYLIDNSPSFRFKFDVALGKKDDPELMCKLLQNEAKKDLERSYPKVTVMGEASTFHGPGGVNRVLFSLLTHGEQRK